jgi:hypothetical protein
MAAQMSNPVPVLLILCTSRKIIKTAIEVKAKSYGALRRTQSLGDGLAMQA